MEPPQLLDAARRRRRVRAVEDLGSKQGRVVARHQLYDAGYTRAEVRHQVRAARWRTLGRHCVVLHTGPLTQEACHWAAVLEGGPRAFIDGASALVLAGLEHFTVERIRVSVPRGARIRHRGTRLDVRQTRRWEATDLAEGEGVPRARPAVAAIRAALWARSDRQATLLLVMSVQQGIVTMPDLASELIRIRRDKRRLLINEVLLELAGGIRSLSELDVLKGCRDRGLPEPDKQVVRRTSSGTCYLDFRWRRWGVVVEVDGIQHIWAEGIIDDAIRHNSIAIDGDIVLRLPVLGLRVCPDAFFDQVELALRSAGWSPPSDRSA